MKIFGWVIAKDSDLQYIIDKAYNQGQHNPLPESNNPYSEVKTHTEYIELIEGLSKQNDKILADNAQLEVIVKNYQEKLRNLKRFKFGVFLFRKAMRYLNE